MALYNIMREHKKTNERTFLSYNKTEWIKINDNKICRLVINENDVEFWIRQLQTGNVFGNKDYTDYYYLKAVNTIKTRTFPICYISDNTGTNSDLDSDIHKGFTIGKGKQMYWMMIWHGSGHVTVFTGDKDNEQPRKRYINGDTQITIHFNN